MRFSNSRFSLFSWLIAAMMIVSASGYMPATVSANDALETTSSEVVDGTPSVDEDTGDVPGDADTGDVPGDADTGDVPGDADTGDVPSDADTGDVPGDADTGDVPSDADTGDVPGDADTGDVPGDAPLVEPGNEADQQGTPETDDNVFRVNAVEPVAQIPNPGSPGLLPVEACMVSLAGNTVMTRDAGVTDREKIGQGGEVNGDGWGAGTGGDGWGQTMRLYGAVDQDTYNVSITYEVQGGGVFGDATNTLVSPGAGALQNNGYTAAVEGIFITSVSPTTITVSIDFMPANSSFSFNIPVKHDEGQNSMYVWSWLTGDIPCAKVAVDVNKTYCQQTLDVQSCDTVVAPEGSEALFEIKDADGNVVTTLTISEFAEEAWVGGNATSEAVLVEGEAYSICEITGTYGIDWSLNGEWAQSGGCLEFVAGTSSIAVGALNVLPPVTPTEEPTQVPTQAPTEEPTQAPTEEPTQVPTEEPTQAPTEEPTQVPTEEPTEEPTQVPTDQPKDDVKATAEAPAVTGLPTVGTGSAASTGLVAAAAIGAASMLAAALVTRRRS